jgi:hypothetical protein
MLDFMSKIFRDNLQNPMIVKRLSELPCERTPPPPLMPGLNGVANPLA